MPSSLKSFGKCIATKTSKVNERAIAFLYFRLETTDMPESSPNELRQNFIDAGLGAPNITRLKEFLRKDKRTAKVDKDKWILKADWVGSATAEYGDCLSGKKVTIVETDSIIPRELTESTRTYLSEVVMQINGCYDAGFFDASGVMIRRLVETLIIEVYEHKEIQEKITDGQGNYYMLKKLITNILAERSIRLGRNAIKGLEDVKWLGDHSAHSRRFLAKKPDIDKRQPNIRLLVEELLYLSNLK